MQIIKNESIYGGLTIHVVVNGISVISVTACADVVFDYKTIHGQDIDRLLRYLAISDYRRLYR